MEYKRGESTDYGGETTSGSEKTWAGASWVGDEMTIRGFFQKGQETPTPQRAEKALTQSLLVQHYPTHLLPTMKKLKTRIGNILEMLLTVFVTSGLKLIVNFCANIYHRCRYPLINVFAIEL